MPPNRGQGGLYQIKGNTLRLLRTNSTEANFQAKLTEFKIHLFERIYPHTLINKILFKNRRQALLKKPTDKKKEIFPFATQSQPAVLNLHIEMDTSGKEKWTVQMEFKF